MIRNYLKIALRDLLKQKGLTFINVFGLSIGLACFSLFLLYALNEFNYDRFHTDGDRIFRVYRWTEDLSGRGTEGDPYLPIPLGPALKADFPDVEDFVRMRDAWGHDFVRVNGVVSRQGISFADPQFFDVLSYQLKYGNRATALKELNSLVLTEKTALKLFGESNPLGRTLEIKNGEQFVPFTVSAVVEDFPSNSSVRFEVLGNFERLRAMPRMEKRWTSWNHSAYYTFVKLRPGSGLAGDTMRLAQFRKKYYPNEEAELREQGYWKGEHPPVAYRLQPIHAMHTQTMVGGGEIPPVEPRSIWTLVAIAAGVLAIACINFTTLAIGRSAGRAREVGVRKVMGSGQRMLIGQFLTESLLLAGISAIFGLTLAKALLPYFNQLADRELVFSFRQFPEMAWMLGGLILLTGILAGIYPALVLSGFRPVEVLKSKIRLGGSNFFTRSLVTAQFVLSVGLIISTLVILRQLDFMRSKNPGFERENVIVVDAEGADSKRIAPLFKQAVSVHPAVAGVANAETSFGAEMGWSRSNWDYNGTQREAYEYFVDPHFLDVLGMELLAGRNFQPGVSLDTVSSIIINEAMARNFGWTPENAIGQQLSGYYEEPERPLPTVVGVVRDFHFRPLKEEIRPQMFHQFADYVPYKYLVRLRPGDPAPALAALKNEWQKLEPVLPFKYSFLDEDLDRFYKAEARTGNIVLWAGGISIFLACLGLFGLVALAVVNRTREIGIRKVLGASVTGISSLLARDFLKLVLIAIGIASPMAWYVMQQWLADFAYRIELEWWVFAAAGAMAVAVAMLTVGFQSVKAALANPVKSLRSE